MFVNMFTIGTDTGDSGTVGTDTGDSGTVGTDTGRQWHSRHRHRPTVAVGTDTG